MAQDDAHTSRREPNEMPLGEHLEELRKRLMHALLGLAPIFAVALIFGQPLLGFLLEPVLHSLRERGLAANVHALGPLETFYAYVKVSFIAAVLVGLPWVLYQLWRFVAPGLYDRERRFVYVILPISAVLTIAGVTLLFVYIMPLVITFFIGFSANVGEVSTPKLTEFLQLPQIPAMAGDPAQPLAGQTWVNTDLKMLRVAIAGADGSVEIVSSPLVRDMTIVPMYQLKDYISLLLSLSIAFAAGFQTPVVVLLLGWVGIVDTTFLRKYRRHALLGAAIAAALLTPGDPASMIIMTIALQLLYELGILLLVIFPARRVSMGLTKGQRERTLAQEPSLRSETDDETP